VFLGLFQVTIGFMPLLDRKGLMLHPDLLIFLGITMIPVLLLARYRRLARLDRGVVLVLVGTGVLSLAALIDYLEETALEAYMLSITDRNQWNMLLAIFGYIPGVFLTGLGLSRWFHVALLLESEINKRKHVEDELRERTIQLKEALVKAEEANRAKTDFLAKMSHELRTPLNAIIGFSEVMNMQLFGRLGGSQYEEYSELINDSGKLLLDIINDILDLSKVEAGSVELEEEAFFLKGLVEECMPIVKSHADQALVALVCEAEDDLVLWADRRIVKQMLLNLLSNAIKFTKETGTVTVRSYASSDGSHTLEVEDSGVGMTEDELEVAMRPFGQVESITTSNQPGTGLGLALVNTFMELHQGTLEVISRKGEGTKALLIFPHARAVKPSSTDKRASRA